ncbi:hypothetical protein LJC58_06320 [Lachnospiraceae bacterium OttesenSCG-928-D06]|nr:hypothetical protein [Lachnospiraceae bacterium OttesenSCG-928-D06]
MNSIARERKFLSVQQVTNQKAAHERAKTKRFMDTEDTFMYETESFLTISALISEASGMSDYE